MSESFGVKVSGLGAYLPSKILTNADLESMVDTTDEWITTRTGIKERHIAAEGEKSSDLGTQAAKEALQNAGLEASDLDLIIVATITPDMLMPSTACTIQNNLGAKCGAFDMAAACSGFPYALGIAESFIRSGTCEHVLVIGSEVLSGFIDWKDRSTCVLFGDGAGAAIVSRKENDGKYGIIASHLGSDGAQGELLMIPGGGSANPPRKETVEAGLHHLKMQGSEVFKVAVRTMEDAVKNVLGKVGLGLDDINYLVPHQANMRILQAVAQRLNLSEEQVYINLDKYGNMSSASTVVAFYEAAKSGKFKKDDIVVLVAFGGGFTWAATVIRWQGDE